MSKARKDRKPLQYILLILLIVLMILSFAVSMIPVGHAQEPPLKIAVAPDGTLYAEGRVLVRFKPSVSSFTAQSTLKSMDSDVSDTAGEIVVAQVPAGETVEGFAALLEAQPNVVCAQPDYLYTLGAVSVNDTYAGDQWYLDAMGVPDAWSATMGAAGVVVAVLDTGIDLSHPDLAGQIVSPTDVVEPATDAQDDNGHGTHVAGIIGAIANNARGVAGIAPGTRLMPVDVFGYYATSSGTVFGALTSKVIEGISYAVSNSADVINISLGGADYDSLFETAVNGAVAAGVVVVAAAGNDGEDGTHYPSDFDACISVIATDWNDDRAGYSNYGGDKDISAPGGDTNADPDYDSLILSTYYNPITHASGYAWMDGTSMASPMVAGVAALVLSANSSLTVAEVKDILYVTAVDLGAPGRDDDYGYGRVNAAAAVAAAAGLPYAPVAVTGVALDDAGIGLSAGETYQLSAHVTPFAASNKAVAFSTANAAVATVSASGVVSATGAGSTQITARTVDGGFTSVCNVSVIDAYVPVTGVSIAGYAPEAHISRFVGESFDISPAVAPANATNKSVAYLSGLPGAASVSDSGHISVKGVGAAKITVTTVDGGHTSSITVHGLRRGDTNADGNISISDYTNIRLHLLGLKALPSEIRPAADVDKNGVISISDYTLVRLHILGLKSID